jgi:hypothetical protein
VKSAVFWACECLRAQCPWVSFAVCRIKDFSGQLLEVRDREAWSPQRLEVGRAVQYH